MTDIVNTDIDNYRTTTEMTVTVLAGTRTHIYSTYMQVPTLDITTGSGVVTFVAPELDDGTGPCLLTEFLYNLADTADRCASLTEELCRDPDHIHVRPTYGPAPDDDDSDSAGADSTNDELAPADDEVGSDELDKADDNSDLDDADSENGPDPDDVDEERPRSVK